MKLRYLVTFFFTAFSKLALAENVQSIDCLDKIPPDLAEKLAASEPGLSLPAKRDLDPASVDYDIKAGGNGCYEVAKGAFDEGRKDAFAIALVAENGHPDLVVASRQNSGWVIRHLPTFCDDIKFCYVKRGGPGTYVRSNALDAPPTWKYEREELKSKHDVIVSGRLESTGVTYANKSGTWFYVWTSD
jgi:hypothetical protein